ncbi:MAG: carbohydrate-binding domain-containing protein [Oscillospiraceae bacterium]|nr:carbohydrate-binding domain-containing protein [Oscillospiraceae bacterium]
MNRLIALLLTLLLLAGCGSGTAPETTPDETQAGVSAETDAADRFTDRDYRTEYEIAECELITLGSEDVLINRAGSYLIQGTLADGQIIVDADKQEKVQLILDGVSITSAASAPIYIRQADKVFITLVGENVLTNGGSFEAIDENNIDAVIFSKEDLTLNGTGSLAISSPAGHGIVSKDELTITGGFYDITCASHGISGKDNLCIADGAFTIAAGKDGLHAENNDDATLGFGYIEGGTFTISAEGDGLSASSTLEIRGGAFDITTGGGSENGAKQASGGWGQMGGGRGPGGPGMGGQGMGFGSMTETETEDSASIKGIKAASDLTITGGSFTLNCADDAVHSNTNVTIKGGDFTIATGDDAFHADDTLTVEGGAISVSESYEGLEGLHILIAGGDISLISSDDGLNAAGGTDASGMGGRDQFGGPGGMGNSDGTIVISGGNIYMEASGDGIDANGTLEITGGFTVVTGPTQGDTATLDYDISATISGGTFIGTGSSMMAQTFSDNTQGIIAVSLGGSASAGTELLLTDAAGEEVVRFTPNLSYAVVILSTPDMVSGETYTITVGTATAEFEAY